MKRILLTAFAVAFLAAFFASTNSDGLDFVSEKLGFAHKSLEAKAIMTGYCMPFLQNSSISTALAGAIGILIIFALFGSAVSLFKKKQ